MKHESSPEEETLAFDTSKKLSRTVLTTATLIPLGFVIFLGAGMYTGARWIETKFTDLHYELRDMQRALDDLSATRWTTQDQEIFTLRLRLQNPNLVVPDSGEIVSRRKEKK